MAQSTPNLKVDAMEVDNVEVQNVTVGTDGNPNVNPMLHRGASGELEVVRGDDTTSEGTRSPNKTQINIKTAAIGTNATLTNNVKLHRGGNGELGIVLADDAEAEGSRSNHHALVQAKSIVLGDSPNQSFNIKMRRAGNGLVQFTLGDDAYADGTFSPDYADVLGSVPVGSIVAWNPGYYLDGLNGTFVNADFLPLNTVAGANSYLNTKGYYVADGSTPGITGSLIWNAAGRHLPNLTDDRFLMGTTLCGSIGGSNVMLDHTHTDNLAAPAHTHSIDHNHPSQALTLGTNVDSGIKYSAATGVSSEYLQQYTPANGWLPEPSSLTVSGTVDLPNYIGTSGAASATSLTGTIGTGSAASATENRPKYLGTFFIVRVF